MDVHCVHLHCFTCGVLKYLQLPIAMMLPSIPLVRVNVVGDYGVDNVLIDGKEAVRGMII
jgi:hypothetical protein